MGYVKEVSHLVSFFIFYLSEVLTDLAKLSLGCEVNGNRLNIVCYADDNALLAHTENALQFMLDTFAPRLENLSLKRNVENSCNNVFKHKSRSISNNFLLQGHPLKQLSEFAYLGVVLIDNLACTSDMEQSKRTKNSAMLIPTSGIYFQNTRFVILCHRNRVQEIT